MWRWLDSATEQKMKSDQITVEKIERFGYIEVLQLLLGPKYLPREFTRVNLSVCYCPTNRHTKNSRAIPAN